MRPLTSIHQIEVTTQCNLRCVYCPSPHLDTKYGRAKEHMRLETFYRALQWTKEFERRGTQGELSITGIGEALLHPDFIEMVGLAREALPSNPIVFSTNGLLLTEDICKALAPYNPRIYVSLHRPEKATHAIHAAARYGLLAGTNSSAALSSFDWAGQVKWPVSAPKIVCEYLRTGWGVVLVDGRITTCCLDATGGGTFAHVDDEIGEAQTRPWDLCSGCHMTVPAEVA